MSSYPLPRELWLILLWCDCSKEWRISPFQYRIKGEALAMVETYQEVVGHKSWIRLIHSIDDEEQQP